MYKTEEGNGGQRVRGYYPRILRGLCTRRSTEESVVRQTDLTGRECRTPKGREGGYGTPFHSTVREKTLGVTEILSQVSDKGPPLEVRGGSRVPVGQ